METLYGGCLIYTIRSHLKLITIIVLKISACLLHNLYLRQTRDLQLSTLFYQIYNLCEARYLFSIITATMPSATNINLSLTDIKQVLTKHYVICLICCFIIDRSCSKLLTLDTSASKSTLRTLFSRTSETHPSLCSKFPAMLFAAATLSVSIASR